MFKLLLELTLPFMASGNIAQLHIKGRPSLRAAVGIAIALPAAAIFCLAYLTMLALEAIRDART